MGGAGLGGGEGDATAPFGALTPTTLENNVGLIGSVVASPDIGVHTLCRFGVVAGADLSSFEVAQLNPGGGNSVIDLSCGLMEPQAASSCSTKRTCQSPLFLKFFRTSGNFLKNARVISCSVASGEALRSEEYHPAT